MEVSVLIPPTFHVPYWWCSLVPPFHLPLPPSHLPLPPGGVPELLPGERSLMRQGVEGRVPDPPLLHHLFVSNARLGGWGGVVLVIYD